METRTVQARKDGRVIIHFVSAPSSSTSVRIDILRQDYDCFYAAVFEAKNPSLRGLPLAVQQKQIIVTANYAARRRGLYKLQLLSEARRICPDVIIELGEDISRFRDASKELYSFIKDFSWNGKVERLGFDEVWLDVTDIVDYNMEVLNRHALQQSFFQVSKHNPLDGFMFDASSIAGHPYPKDYEDNASSDDTVKGLTLRLRLGSHLALHIRHQLEEQKGYTSTVGIATSKLVSKLVGSLNKPKGQTTLMPALGDHCQAFLDGHDIGKVPGIGFKMAQKLREFVLQRPASYEFGLVLGGTRENVSVSDVRNHPQINPEMLEKLFAGPGSARGIGYKVWCLLHAIDDTEVSQAKAVPSQISIEDSYIRLDTMPEVLRELEALAKSLLTRMRVDLLGDEDVFDEAKDEDDNRPVARELLPVTSKKWLAHPKTLRLTTRPRLPLQSDGTRVRSFKRISHSGPLPTFVFNLQDSIESIADKLVRDALVGMFRKLHPEKAGWNLSLVNLGVTNMAETAGDSKTANGRDIGNMFKRQEDVLKDFTVTDITTPTEQDALFNEACPTVAEDIEENGDWDEQEAEHDEPLDCCPTCGSHLPSFAMIAHQRFHSPAVP